MGFRVQGSGFGSLKVSVLGLSKRPQQWEAVGMEIPKRRRWEWDPPIFGILLWFP